MIPNFYSCKANVEFTIVCFDGVDVIGWFRSKPKSDTLVLLATFLLFCFWLTLKAETSLLKSTKRDRRNSLMDKKRSGHKSKFVKRKLVTFPERNFYSVVPYASYFQIIHLFFLSKESNFTDESIAHPFLSHTKGNMFSKFIFACPSFEIWLENTPLFKIHWKLSILKQRGNIKGFLRELTIRRKKIGSGEHK